MWGIPCRLADNNKRCKEMLNIHIYKSTWEIMNYVWMSMLVSRNIMYNVNQQQAKVFALKWCKPLMGQLVLMQLKVGWRFMLDHELCLDFSADLLTTTSTAKKFQTHMRSKTLIIYAGKTWQTCWQQQVPCSAALHGNIKHKWFQIQLWTMVGFLRRLADNSKHWMNIPNIHIYKHMMSCVGMSLLTHW